MIARVASLVALLLMGACSEQKVPNAGKDLPNDWVAATKSNELSAAEVQALSNRANTGDRAATIELFVHYRRTDPTTTEGRKAVEAAADTGEPEAMILLARMAALNGQPGCRDALSWYSKALVAGREQQLGASWFARMSEEQGRIEGECATDQRTN
jgi:hypothetical protein